MFVYVLTTLPIGFYSKIVTYGRDQFRWQLFASLNDSKIGENALYNSIWKKIIWDFVTSSAAACNSVPIIFKILWTWKPPKMVFWTSLYYTYSFSKLSFYKIWIFFFILNYIRHFRVVKRGKSLSRKLISPISHYFATKTNRKCCQDIKEQRLLVFIACNCISWTINFLDREP